MLPRQQPPVPSASRPLRVGFLALTDAAPLIVAQEHGLFARQGLQVQLSREVGWATIREKIIHGELDAAQAPAPMLWSTILGLDCAPCPVLTALVLNLHGNAITLSCRLRVAGVRDAATLRTEALRRRSEQRITLGVVFPFSSHHLLLRQWLTAAGIDPDRDLRIVVVPPAQMFHNLQAGTLDGYCAGEPWGSLAVQAGEGWCPAWSAALSPGHVEKVLMVRESFALTRPADHLGLVRATAAAAAWCDDRANRAALATLLTDPRYLKLPVRAITPALAGRFEDGTGRTEDVPDFHVFSDGDANRPTIARAAQIQAELVAAGLVSRAAADFSLPRRLFREDLFLAALSSANSLHAQPDPQLPDGTLAPA